MDITVSIPEWAKEKPIYIIAGKELIAYREVFTSHEDYEHITKPGPLMQKTERCNGCGQCCKNCVFLHSNGCGFGSQIPMSCLVSDCSKGHDKCTERFMEA